MGLKELGVEQIGPIATNGVLLDIARLHDVDCLPAGYEITPADMEAALDEYGMTVQPGDVVLLRTGWVGSGPTSRASSTPTADARARSRRRRMARRSPGRCHGGRHADLRGRQAAGERATGTARLLVEAGVYLFETLNLEDLAQTGEHAFFFVAAPLKLVGATASPIAPLAFVWPPPDVVDPAPQPNASV